MSEEKRSTVAICMTIVFVVVLVLISCEQRMRTLELRRMQLGTNTIEAK